MENIIKLPNRFIKTDLGIIYKDPVTYKIECDHCNYSTRDWGRDAGNVEFDGKEVQHTETCATCNGKGKIKGERKYKGAIQKIKKTCSDCNGHGWKELETPLILGPCKHCGGTHIETKTASLCDWMTKDDLDMVFELIDWDDSVILNRDANFYEEYLGLGIVCGVTDYGRYKSMSPEQFKTEVTESFYRFGHQYISIYKKEKFPFVLKISKHNSGWMVKPIYN
jgi:hypothetical protein